jgi:uncharacterized tellurite resistance protein B-like protein
MPASLMTALGLLFTMVGVFLRAERGTALIAQYVGSGWADFIGYGFVGAGFAFFSLGVIGLIFAIFAGLLGGARKARAENPEQARRKIETFHRLLGGAAARMAGADGAISDAETAMVGGILEKYGNLRFTEKEIRALSSGGVKESQAFLDSVRQARGDLTGEQREQIVRAALLVAMADLRTDEDELSFLKALADALGLSESELARIRDGVANVTQRLVGAASALA